MVRDAKGAGLDALWLAEVSILSLLGQMPAVASRDWGTLGGGPNMCEFDVVAVSHTHTARVDDGEGILLGVSCCYPEQLCDVITREP